MQSTERSKAAATGTHEALVRSVLNHIEERRDDIVALLQRMIRTKSVNPSFDPSSPGEGAMAELVTGEYEKLGVPVETYEAEPGRTNVVARVRGTDPEGPHLLVNCHLDTVDAAVDEWIDPFTGETVTEWTTDPFGGEIRDGRIYGRGAADHKSPIAAILAALDALRAHGVTFRGSLTCIHDADEETGGRLGLAHLRERMPFDFDMALYACTSEFTPLGREFFTAMGEDNIVRAIAGWHTYELRFEGQNLHNMTPLRGYGAVEAAHAFLRRIQPYIDEVNSQVDPVEGTAHPTMRLSGIDTGPRVAFHHQAETCTVVLNRRISPSVDPEAALADLQAFVDKHNEEFPKNPATLRLARDIKAHVTPDDHPVVTGLARAVRQVTGGEPSVVGMPAPVGISEMLSKYPIPTVLFGYGLVNMHHAIDEHIDIEALIKTAKAYAVALIEWLEVDGDRAS